MEAMHVAEAEAKEKAHQEGMWSQVAATAING